MAEYLSRTSITICIEELHVYRNGDSIECRLRRDLCRLSHGPDLRQNFPTEPLKRLWQHTSIDRRGTSDYLSSCRGVTSHRHTWIQSSPMSEL